MRRRWPCAPSANSHAEVGGGRRTLGTSFGDADRGRIPAPATRRIDQAARHVAAADEGDVLSFIVYKSVLGRWRAPTGRCRCAPWSHLPRSRARSLRSCHRQRVDAGMPRLQRIEQRAHRAEDLAAARDVRDAAPGSPSARATAAAVRRPPHRPARRHRRARSRCLLASSSMLTCSSTFSGGEPAGRWRAATSLGRQRLHSSRSCTLRRHPALFDCRCADPVPFEAELAQGFDLWRNFLHVVLAERTLARFGQRGDFRSGAGLRHRQQADRIWPVGSHGLRCPEQTGCRHGLRDNAAVAAGSWGDCRFLREAPYCPRPLFCDSGRKGAAGKLRPPGSRRYGVEGAGDARTGMARTRSVATGQDRPDAVTTTRAAGECRTTGNVPPWISLSYWRFRSKNKASDLHLSGGLPPMIRVDGDVRRINIPADSTTNGCTRWSTTSCRTSSASRLRGNLEVDFSFEIPGLARFRVNAFNQNRWRRRGVPHHSPTMLTSRPGLPEHLQAN